MPKALVSVIVPIFMVEEYLDECIQSIVGQTYSNLEIILVDDGSLDGCPQKCDEWSRKDHRIRVIHKPNGGLSSARNAGLDIAKELWNVIYHRYTRRVYGFLEQLMLNDNWRRLYFKSYQKELRAIPFAYIISNYRAKEIVYIHLLKWMPGLRRMIRIVREAINTH